MRTRSKPRYQPPFGQIRNLVAQLIFFKLQHYLGVRKHADDFRTHLQEQLNRLEGHATRDLLSKNSSLSAFAFEAAVKLKSWDSLEQLVKARSDSDAIDYFHATELCRIRIARETRIQRPSEFWLTTFYRLRRQATVTFCPIFH